MNVKSQAITFHTLSKYRVDVAYLLEVCLPYVCSRVNLVLSKDIDYITVVSRITWGELVSCLKRLDLLLLNGNH